MLLHTTWLHLENAVGTFPRFASRSFTTFVSAAMDITRAKVFQKRNLVGAAFSLGTILLTLLLFQTPFLHVTVGTDIFQALERKVFDILLRARGERDHGQDVMLVRIDEYTINKLNNEYPIPRDLIGRAMTAMSAFGAKAVALDVFIPPSTRDSLESQLMVELLSTTDNTFQSIGAFIPSQTERDAVSRRDVDSTAHYVIGRFGIPAPAHHAFPRAPYIDDYPFKELADVSRGIGHTTLILDTLDGIMRSGPLYVEYAGRLYPSLGFALALHAMGIPPTAVRFEEREIGTLVTAGSLEIQTGPVGEVLINFVGPGKVFPEASLYDILLATENQDVQYLSQFEGKVCIIGPTSRAVGDYYSMPYSEGAPGYLAHANMYDMIMTGNFIYAADPLFQFILLVILVLLVGVAATTRKTRETVVITVGAVIVFCVFAYLAFASGNTLYKLAEPLFAIFLCFGSTLAYRAATEGRQRKLITGMFERYVDKEVVQQLIDDPKRLSLGGEQREITLLFSDVKGFTTLSERLGPANLVKVINGYLTEMTNIIMKNRGTVDKFIGDAIMAFWGAPLADRDAEFHACLSALEMQRRLEQLHPKWKKYGDIEIKQRVGINTGVSLVGNMGSDQKFNYTAMGDPVNVASRLEGVNKQYGTYILLSEMTYQKVAKKIVAREIDYIQVVGKTEPVRIYELLGLSDKPLSDYMKFFLELYSDGLKAYRERKWEEGIGYFQSALTYIPNDTVCQIYIERMNLFKFNPPAEDWNGVFVLSSK